MALLALCYVITVSFIASVIVSKRRYDRDRDSIAYRVHVNGIRGKSTVTRYVAAVLRSAGLETYGKTTGTAARVILPNGRDEIIGRRGYANVNEQIGIVRSFAARKAQAIVMECMAINPDYQDWLENKVMHSHITIITNVRIDHQEEMGQTLLDIGRSLARSIPRNAIVITAERQPEVLAMLRAESKRKHSRLILAPTQAVNDQDLLRFGHMAHRENVAIGLAVAKLFKVSPERAMRAMTLAPADPGAFQVQHFSQQDKQVAWANLFAVNDKESFAETAATLAKKYAGYYRIALLNNRHDRPSRVELFSELAENDYRAHAIVALGDYEDRVQKAVRRKSTKVALLGNKSRHADASGKILFEKILDLADKPKVLIVGTVNIHTRQVEHILEHIEAMTGSAISELASVYQPVQAAPKRAAKQPARKRPAILALGEETSRAY